MTRFPFFLVLFAIIVIIVVVKRSPCAFPTIQQHLNLGDSFLPPKTNFPITSEGQVAVNRIRCPKEWYRFGGSCYSLSNVTSTSVEANQTCVSLHLNTSLMHIRQSAELYYAAYILTINHFETLMVGIDPHLFKGKQRDVMIANMLLSKSKDYIRWKQFEEEIRQTSLEYDKSKKQMPEYSSNKHISHDDNQIDRIVNEQMESQPTNFIKDKMNHRRDDHDEFDNFDKIFNVCHQIKLNVVNKDSNVFILTTYHDSGKTVCSLSDNEPTMAFPHLCQHMIDACLGNFLCGESRSCVNTPTDFECSCFFFSDGRYCDEWSSYNLVIAFGIMLIVCYVLFILIQKYLFPIAKGIINHFRRRSTKSKKTEEYEMSAEINEPTKGSAQHPAKIANQQTSKRFNLCNSLKKMLCSRLCWVVGLTVVYFSFLFVIPAVYHIKQSRIVNTDSFQLDSLINYTIGTMIKCSDKNTVLWGNSIQLFTSIILIIIFSCLNEQNTQYRNSFRSRLGLLPPLRPFGITDRFVTAIISGIEALEMLGTLEEWLVDIDKSSGIGVVVQLLKRILIVILIGFRYYPILASLHVEDVKVRCLAWIYMMGSIVFMTIHAISCLTYLPISKKLSSFDEAHLHMDLHGGSLLYGFVKHALHCLLFAYIAAELTVRFAYDSVYETWKRRRSSGIPLDTKKEDFSFSKENNNKRFSEDSMNDKANGEDQKCCSSKIYKWEHDFRFITIVLCIYTVAFIILVHLTCTFIFLYTTQKTSYIALLNKLFGSILKIDAKELSFHYEAVFSALMAMVIYGVQLFLGIKQYRKDIRRSYDNARKIPLHDKLKKSKVLFQGMQYSGFVFRHLSGGVIICCHTIFLIIIILRVIVTQIISRKWVPLESASGSLKWVFVFLISPLVLYVLQKIIRRVGGRIGRHLTSAICIPILLHFMFIYSIFNGIFSYILYLIIGILRYVMYMPRIDYSKLGLSLEKLDDEYDVYNSFLLWEILYANPFGIDALSTVVQQPNLEDLPISEKIVTAELIQLENQPLINKPEDASSSAQAVESEQSRVNDTDFNDIITPN